MKKNGAANQKDSNSVVKRMVVIVLIPLLLWSTEVTAESLKIATLDVAPYGFKNEQQVRGILYDITCKIAEEAGITYTNELYPFTRMVNIMGEGEVDLAITLPHTAMKEVAIPILPVVPSENVVIGVKGTLFQTLEDLHGKTVGLSGEPVMIRRSPMTRRLQSMKSMTIVRVSRCCLLIVLMR